MDFMFDWEAEGDRFSFEDSDRFEEDSLCSWISEPESLCNNWRGWRKNGGQQGHLGTISKGGEFKFGQSVHFIAIFKCYFTFSDISDCSIPKDGFPNRI
jgi:hypothetical protein